MTSRTAQARPGPRPSGGIERAGGRGARPGRRLWPRLDWFEWLVLAALAASSLITVVLLVHRARAEGLTWMGTDGLTFLDQAQYVAWVRLAGEHVLISNPYSIPGTPASFMHPGVLASGVLYDLGLPAWLAYLLWKPVAVLGLFAAARAYVVRTVPGLWARRAALVLALFWVAPVLYVVGAGGVLGISGTDLDYARNELWPGYWLWGYPFTALAVAALAAALLAYARDRARDRIVLTAPLLGLATSWLQPWQGATLIVALIGSEALCWAVRRRRPPLRLCLATVGPAALPLVYYAVLSRYDPAWRLVKELNDVHISAVAVVVSLVPLVLAAAVVYARPPADFDGLALRVWPLAGLAVFAFVSATDLGTFAPHALQGVGVPLAVLAVLGMARIFETGGAGRVVTYVAVSVAVVLGGLSYLDRVQFARKVLRSDATNAYLLRPGERDALAYLAGVPGAGGVFADLRIGLTVPMRTDRRVWLGALSWTPDWWSRVALARRLVSGGLDARQTRQVVLASGARFVLTDCTVSSGLARKLAPILENVRRFDCASVYTIRRTPGPSR